MTSMSAGPRTWISYCLSIFRRKSFLNVGVPVVTGVMVLVKFHIQIKLVNELNCLCFQYHIKLQS
jgi:hypothetical protein